MTFTLLVTEDDHIVSICLPAIASVDLAIDPLANLLLQVLTADHFVQEGLCLWGVGRIIIIKNVNISATARSEH